MINRTITVQLLVLITGILLPFGTNAAEIRGIYFEETHTVENTTLNLTGVGLLRYWGFKAYVGAFYLEEGLAASQASVTANQVIMHLAGAAFQQLASFPSQTLYTRQLYLIFQKALETWGWDVHARPVAVGHVAWYPRAGTS